MLLKNGYIRNLLFIDIETVPEAADYDLLPEEGQLLWERKYSLISRDESNPEDGYMQRAGIFAEFGKIVCISVGYFRYDSEAQKDFFRIKSFYGADEKQLLTDFIDLLNSAFCKRDTFHFCGHNIKEFDIPYICRRILINRLTLPEILDISGKKPWEIGDVDTLYLWRFGDYKNYTSLRLLAYVLGIPSPKDDIEGKDIATVFYTKNDIDRIVRYCQQDVITVARLLMRFRNEVDPLSVENIIYLSGE